MKLALFLLFALPLQAQTVRNFDKVLTPDNPTVVIQPPPGQTWTLLRGSFAVSQGAIDRGLDGLNITVFEQEGDADGLCTNLIRVSLKDAPWVPIVGGYVAHPVWGNLRGQEEPIVLRYPNRLVIHVGGLTGRLATWTRFTIQ